ncbi:uncharacterized protein LOC117929673 [Vitis riparia]|uniref:uncharacterized protein LOC117929673 n=1 Tax=Vitis riparia TaxID=96939 RepID=UPI00155A2B05|nr:uncharacterized protein LOC117929673 [Vitis riparia]
MFPLMNHKRDNPKLVDSEGNKPNPNCGNPKPSQNPEEAHKSMATIAAVSSLSSICKTSIHCHGASRHSSSSMKFPVHRNCAANCFGRLTVKNENRSHGSRKIRSVAEETLVPEEEGEEGSSVDQPVSVPVSPSDILTMFFQAEGTMNETAIPTVTKALEETEGITTLKVQVVEGIASVALTKQTTVQATGVASSLVETIQGSGFKLQTLNLSFEDEEEIIE